jgi:glutathione S-transferase
LRYAFPERMKSMTKDDPKVVTIVERVSELPKLKEYLASDRRLAFNERGLFRHYPELDAP